MDDLVELGRTAGAYGFRGWVRIVPLESGEVLQKARTWVLTDLKGVRTTLSIEAFRRHGDGFIAKWAGCETKEAADAARGRVSVSRADFPDAGKDAVWAFFNDTATTEIYTLSLHDALPICREHRLQRRAGFARHCLRQC